MKKLFSVFSVLLFCLILAVYLLPTKIFAADSVPALSNIVISELQTGGCVDYDANNPGECVSEDGDMEFIELYNPLSIDLDVTGWQVQYVSSSGASSYTLASFDGKIRALSYLLLSHTGYMSGQNDFSFDHSLAKSGGYIKIVDAAGSVIDMVGWGTAAFVGDWPKLPEIKPGYSVKRILPGDPLGVTGAVFTPPTLPLAPQYDGYVINQTDDNNENDDPVDEDGDTQSDDDPGGKGAGPLTSCDGLVISELLPNPAGSDTGNEFIELYNPTEDFIPLAGCKLQTSANSKIYELTDGQISPGQYQTFYNDNTGLTLANSGGGSVYLIDTDSTEIYRVDYPTDLDDDVSWSLLDGSWSKTFSATPNKPNELLQAKPCPSGQVRNTDTNRCINIVEEAAGLATCPAGKKRNPDTNRCRNILSLASTLKACASGQERNPATNRCRKITSSTASLTPCKPGQERNPDTHRCRKVSSVGSSGGLNEVKDVLSASKKQFY